MMMGIVLYIKGLRTIPNVLRVAFECKNWNVLPNSGGSREQPAGLLIKMNAALNMHRSYKLISSAPAGQATKVADSNRQAFTIYSQMETSYREWKKQQNEST